MGDEQARVVSAVTLDSHTGPPSPSAGLVVGAVDTNEDVLIFPRDQASSSGLALGQVVDESMCWVNSHVIALGIAVKVRLLHARQSVQPIMSHLQRSSLTTKNSNLSKKFVEL